MHENDAKIHQVSSIVGGGVLFTTSLVAVIAILFVLERAPDSRLRLAAIVILSAWSVAIYAFGFIIPYDITRYLMQVLWSQYWAATFQENWKPGDKVRHGWIRGLLDVPWHTLRILKRIVRRWDKLIEFLATLVLIILYIPFWLFKNIVFIPTLSSGMELNERNNGREGVPSIS